MLKVTNSAVAAATAAALAAGVAAAVAGSVAGKASLAACHGSRSNCCGN